MCPRTGLDKVDSRKILFLPGLEPRSLRRRYRSQSLYRLLCSGLLYVDGVSKLSARIGPV
jgi:hypothetical protein